mmetsp:Transcript_33039/g.60584  ORF Transcript_33039/g.60584 Transcript_33039/m.60584 type:complete len:136 (+) Transcript_33039:85-492(+)
MLVIRKACKTLGAAVPAELSPVPRIWQHGRHRLLVRCASTSSSEGSTATLRSTIPAHTPPVVQWKKKKFCPECGKRVVAGEKEDMRSSCDRMWRKFMRLSDLHCPLFRYCLVKEQEGHDVCQHLWAPMPYIKGRS